MHVRFFSFLANSHVRSFILGKACPFFLVFSWICMSVLLSNPFFYSRGKSNESKLYPLLHWCSCPPITFSNMASVDSPHQGLFCFFSLVHSWMHKKRINICLGYDIYFNIVQAHFPMRPGKFMNRFWNLDLWECYRELMISREMLAGPWKYDTFGEC